MDENKSPRQEAFEQMKATLVRQMEEARERRDAGPDSRAGEQQALLNATDTPRASHDLD